MTKTKFYEELERIGVDISDKSQMKIWSVALLNMAKDVIANKTRRCNGCYFSKNAILDDGFHLELCKNEFCPIKNLPDNPAAVVDYLFKRDEPMDLKTFFKKYVSPILDALIEEEKKAQNAGN